MAKRGRKPIVKENALQMASPAASGSGLSGMMMIMFWLLCCISLSLLVVAEIRRAKVKVDIGEPFEEKTCKYYSAHVATVCSAGAAFLILISQAVLLWSTRFAALFHLGVALRSLFAVSWLLFLLLEVATIMLARKNEIQTKRSTHTHLSIHCYQLPGGVFISSAAIVIIYTASSTVYSILINRFSPGPAEGELALV